MRYRRTFAIAILAIASLSACSDPQMPAAPTPLPPVLNAPPSSIIGEIAIRSIVPEPGVAVPARACAPGSIRMCADQPQITFDVVVDQDIPNAVLTVSFSGCGYARTPVTALTAGMPTSMSTSVIDLSDDSPQHDGVGAELFCTLPAVTTKMIVQLWRSGEPTKSLLVREFLNAYTFMTSNP